MNNVVEMGNSGGQRRCGISGIEKFRGLRDQARRVSSVLVILVLSACTPGPQEAVVSDHPWYRAPHQFGEDSIALAPWQVYPVEAVVVDEAIAELEEVSYVQISPAIASHYAQREMRLPPVARPFLVRALDAGNSEFTVMQSASALWVRASAGDGSSLRRQPLVVLLDPTPVGIFVTVDDRD
ncbi:MAG: hypothetical protein O7H40_11205 [Gammaproteobacteria bacterium]|nr:hypothetical protein [Gammaproteobacteria bacterium]